MKAAVLGVGSVWSKIISLSFQDEKQVYIAFSVEIAM